MRALWQKIVGAEPIVVAAVSGVSVWEAIPPVLAAFGHPLTDAQIHALAGLLTAIAVAYARSKAVAPDTHAAAVQNALRQSV